MSDNGYSSFFKIGKETTYGTSVVPDLDPLILDATGNISGEHNLELHHGTNSRKAVCSTYGNFNASGAINGKLQGGRLIAYTLGSDSISTDDGITTHTITPQESIPSFTLDQTFRNNQLTNRISGCKISDMSITLDVGGVLTSSFNLVGSKIAPIDAVSTLTKSTNCPMPAYMGTITWGGNTIDCKAFNFNYNNTLGTEEFNIGSRLRQELPEGAITHDGSFTLIFKNFNVYNDFQTEFTNGTEIGTKKNLTLSVSNGLSGSNERGYAFNLSGCALTSVDTAIELGEGRVVQEYSYTPTAITSIIVKDTIDKNYITGV